MLLNLNSGIHPLLSSIAKESLELGSIADIFFTSARG